MRIFRDWTADRWIALAAALAAVCSITVTAYVAYLIRVHDRLSVQPRIILTFDYNATGAGWLLLSVGLGPAEARRFAVYVDGKPQPHWVAVAEALGLPHPDKIGKFSVVYPGSLYAVGLKAQLYRVNSEPNRTELLRRADRVKIEICYCSAYKECWRQSTEVGSHKQDSCDTPDPVRFTAPPIPLT